MATSALTPAQLDAAATAAKAVPQVARPTKPWTNCVLTFRQADAASGTFANKLVVEVDVGDGGAPVVIACDDTTVFAAAEIIGIPTMLKRAVVEALARKGAV